MPGNLVADLRLAQSPRLVIRDSRRFQLSGGFRGACGSGADRRLRVLGPGLLRLPRPNSRATIYFFRIWRFDFPLRRTPGPPPLGSINSMPAASSTRCNASIVRSFNSSPRSKRATVSIDTLAAAASSRTPQPRAARAIRHCTGNKIITNTRFQLQCLICALSCFCYDFVSTLALAPLGGRTCMCGW
jgi:hypothetical protein